MIKEKFKELIKFLYLDMKRNDTKIQTLQEENKRMRRLLINKLSLIPCKGFSFQINDGISIFIKIENKGDKKI